MSDEDIIESIWLTGFLLKDPQYYEDGRVSMELAVSQKDGSELYISAVAGKAISQYLHAKQVQQADMVWMMGDLHTRRDSTHERWVHPKLVCTDLGVEE